MTDNFRNSMCEAVLDISQNTFGDDEVTYIHMVDGVETSRETIRGIFEGIHLEVNPETQTAIATNKPELDVKINDLSTEPIQDDEVIVAGEQYIVADSQEDGRGASKLTLVKKNA